MIVCLLMSRLSPEAFQASATSAPQGVIGKHLQQERERAGQIPEEEDEEWPLEVFEAEHGGAVGRLLTLRLPAVRHRRLTLL